MNNAPRHKSKARANVHRHGSNYSLTTTASSARILGCLNASTEPMRTSTLRSTNSIAFSDASRRQRGLITRWAVESSEPKSLKSVGSSAAPTSV